MESCIIYNLLDFLNIFPLDEHIDYFKSTGNKRTIIVVTNKGEYEFRVFDYSKLINEIIETDNIIV